jgi:hypothetical protein
MYSKDSRTDFGLPGKLMINDLPRIPLTPLDNIPLGVIIRLFIRNASEMPGVCRSITSIVASGVTSRGENPVPPRGNDKIKADHIAHVDQFIPYLIRLIR